MENILELDRVSKTSPESNFTLDSALFSYPITVGIFKRKEY